MGSTSSTAKPTRWLGKALLAQINCQGAIDDDELAKRIWQCYDSNKSGTLELAEAKNFAFDLNHVLKQRGYTIELHTVYKALGLQGKPSTHKITFEEFFGGALQLDMKLLEKKNTNTKLGFSKGVEIFGLKEMKYLNGVRGTYLGKDSDTNRHKIRVLKNAGTSEVFLIKSQNIRLAKPRIYAFTFEAIRGSASSLSVNSIQFEATHWGYLLGMKKNNVPKAGELKHLHSQPESFVIYPNRVITPGATQNRKALLHYENSNLNKLNWDYTGDWRDFSWGARRKTTMIMYFHPTRPPITRYRIMTSRKSKWRDPVKWTVSELDHTTGNWNVIEHKLPLLPTSRRSYSLHGVLPVSFENKEWKEVPMMSREPLKKSKKEKSLEGKIKKLEIKEQERKAAEMKRKKFKELNKNLSLPTSLPDLSRQKSFEPVEVKNTWELVQLQRQRSVETNKAANVLVDELAHELDSDEHNILFLSDKKREIFLPSVVPAEVLALKSSNVLIIAEYANLKLTRWNTSKKGHTLYNQIKTKIKGSKPMDVARTVIKQMEANLLKNFGIKATRSKSGSISGVISSSLFSALGTLSLNPSSYNATSSDPSLHLAPVTFLQLRAVLMAFEYLYEEVNGRIRKNMASTGMAAEEYEKKMKEEQRIEMEDSKMKKNISNEMEGLREELAEERKKMKKLEVKRQKEESKNLPEVVKVANEAKAIKKKKIINYGYQPSKPTSSNGGTGYGGHAGINQKARKQIANKKLEAKDRDQITAAVVSCLSSVVNTLKNKGIDSTKACIEIAKSGVNELFANYLRSTFMQIAERRDVYLVILRTCEAIASLNGGAQMLSEESIFGRADLVNLLQAIKRQVSIYVSPESKQAGSDAEMIRMASFAAEVDRIIGNVLSSWKSYQKEMKKRQPVGTSDGKETKMSKMEKLKKRLSDISVDMVDLLGSKVPHVFKKEFLKNAVPTRVTKRLTQEIASMMTGLPPGIFLRIDNKRMDVMRACIIAPGDSPYENGVFFFDIWIPGSYPSAPPKCKIITTNKGTCRFNPNLYSNGKVCLSLLGTWSGPGWDPTYSNILQVLLSIQSMILGAPHPIVNEPSWSSQAKTPRSFQYNTWLMSATASYAMRDHLLSLKKGSKDVKKLEAKKTDPGKPKFGYGRLKPAAPYRDLPPYWQSSVDPISKYTYFWNNQTGATQWNKPTYKTTVSPLEGFREIINLHFWIKKDYILKEQLVIWKQLVNKTSPKSPYGGRAGTVDKSIFRTLSKELQTLKEPEIEAEEDEDDDDNEDSDDSDF